MELLQTFLFGHKIFPKISHDYFSHSNKLFWNIWHKFKFFQRKFYKRFLQEKSNQTELSKDLEQSWNQWCLVLIKQLCLRSASKLLIISHHIVRFCCIRSQSRPRRQLPFLNRLHLLVRTINITQCLSSYLYIYIYISGVSYKKKILLKIYIYFVPITILQNICKLLL